MIQLNVIYFAIFLVLLFLTFLFLFLKMRNKNIKGQKKDYYFEATVKKESLGEMLKKAFLGKTLSNEDYAKIEEILIRADIGISITNELLNEIKNKKIENIDKAIEILKDKMNNIVLQKHYELEDGVLNILLVLGVNGVGKTTSIGKIANYFLKKGKKVLLAAGDTFRAAATEQLTKWAKILDIPVIKQHEGADPASVVFDAIDSAKSKKVDLLIVDTAGRLHNKKGLMDELVKIYKIIESKGGCNRKNLLVIDANTGQNAFHQAEGFKEAVGVDYIMMTKYDAMSKGGIVLNISKKLNIPFAFVGVGEKIDDIELFDKNKFIERIF